MALNNGGIIFFQNFIPTELFNPWNLSNHLNLNIEKIARGCLTEVFLGENFFESLPSYIWVGFVVVTESVWCCCCNVCPCFRLTSSLMKNRVVQNCGCYGSINDTVRRPLKEAFFASKIVILD